MARKRFSDLQRVYNALKLAKVDVATLPAKLDISHYGKWKEGETTRKTIVRPSLGVSVSVGIKAFGLPATDEAGLILVQTNNRAKTELNAGLAKLGIDLTALEEYKTNGSFVPAKMSFTKKGEKTSETSDITGRKYRKNPGKSYSLPFGQTTAIKHFQEAITAILAATEFTTYFMSAQPEQWRRD